VGASTKGSSATDALEGLTAAAALEVPDAEAAPPPDFAAAAGVGCCRRCSAGEADAAAEFAVAFAASGAMALLAPPPVLGAETPAACGCCLACCGCGCFAIAAVAGCSAAAGRSLEGPPGAAGCALLVAAGPTAAACGVDGCCLARPRSGEAVRSARAGLAAGAAGAAAAACRWAA